MRHTIEQPDRQTYNVYTFDTLSEFLDALKPRRDGESQRHFTGGDPWAGTATYQEALKLAREGWPEGLKLVRPIVDRVVRDAVRWVEEPSTKPDIEGTYFDPGLVAQGIPECCYAPDPDNPQPAFRSTVRLAVNLAVSSAVSAEACRKRGAAFMALALALDALNIKNELWVTETIGDAGNGKGHEFRVLVKAEGEPLQYDKAAFMLIHPSMLRRVIFAYQETLNEPCSYGVYGRPADSFLPTDFTLQGNAAALLAKTPIDQLDAWVLAQVERFVKGE